MALTLGAHHVQVGTGQFAIAQPVGLVVSVSGIPSYVARDSPLPVLYHRMGWVNLGTALGWQPKIDLVHVPQLVYPLEPEFTILRVNLLPGETATVDEIAKSDTFKMRPMPWDRTPAPWEQAATIALATTQADVEGLSYTVPAGKLLMLSSLVATSSRTVLGTASGQTISYATVGGVIVAYAAQRDNVLGAVLTGQLSAGPLYLPAGSVISWHYSRTEVGGGHWVQFFAAGTLFDA